MLASWLPRVLLCLLFSSMPRRSCRSVLAGRSWLGRIFLCCFPILHSVGRGGCRCMLAGCRRLGRRRLGRICLPCFRALRGMTGSGGRRILPSCCWLCPSLSNSWYTRHGQLSSMPSWCRGRCRPTLAGCACLGSYCTDPLHSLPSMPRCGRGCMLARNCNNRFRPLPCMTGSGRRRILARRTYFDLPSMPGCGRWRYCLALPSKRCSRRRRHSWACCWAC